MKVFDTVTRQYYPFEDYSESLTNVSLLGRVRTVTAIVTHTDGNAKFTSVAHGFLTGQNIAISGTVNYDGSYVVTVINADTFVCLECPYVANEASASVYPVMDSVYYITYLQGIEDVFNKVKKMSGIRGMSMKDKESRTLIQEFAMTEDHEEIFLLFAREISDKVFSKMSAYARSLQNAYLFNEKIDFDGDGAYTGIGESVYQIHMAISVAPTTVDINSFSLINQTVLDALVYGILAQWFRTKDSPQDYQVYESRFMDLLRELGMQLGRAEGKRGSIMHNFI